MNQVKAIQQTAASTKKHINTHTQKKTIFAKRKPFHGNYAVSIIQTGNCGKKIKNKKKQIESGSLWVKPLMTPPPTSRQFDIGDVWTNGQSRLGFVTGWYTPTRSLACSRKRTTEIEQQIGQFCNSDADQANLRQKHNACLLKASTCIYFVGNCREKNLAERLHNRSTAQ